MAGLEKSSRQTQDLCFTAGEAQFRIDAGDTQRQWPSVRRGTGVVIRDQFRHAASLRAAKICPVPALLLITRKLVNLVFRRVRSQLSVLGLALIAASASRWRASLLNERLSVASFRYSHALREACPYR